jgi:tetratricopeptide (TPR) repeat protein
MLNRRILLRLAALGALLWLVQAWQTAYRDQHRRELSRALRPALDEGEWQAVARLVRQGADPFTRGMDGSTALAAVLTQGDVPATRKILSQHPTDLGVVDREVARLPCRAFEPLYRLEECVATLERLTGTPGASPASAWSGLAELRFRLGRYDEAAEAYRTLLRLTPGEAQPSRRLRAAAACARAAQKIRPLLSEAVTIRQVLPASADEEPHLWFALYTLSAAPGELGAFRRVTVGLFQVDETGARRVGPEVPIRAPGYDGGAARAMLFADDLTGDGFADAAVEVVNVALGSTPSYLVILTASPRGLETRLTLASSEPLWIEDLNADGRCEVITQHEIGSAMSHVEQPRWRDVYAFNGTAYRQSNRQFPREFTSWEPVLKAALAEHPGDREILEYLGRTYEILGRGAEAIPYYRQAEAAFASEINSADPAYATELRQRRETIRKRLRDLPAKHEEGR